MHPPPHGSSLTSAVPGVDSDAGGSCSSFGASFQHGGWRRLVRQSWGHDSILADVAVQLMRGEPTIYANDDTLLCGSYSSSLYVANSGNASEEHHKQHSG